MRLVLLNKCIAGQLYGLFSCHTQQLLNNSALKKGNNMKRFLVTLTLASMFIGNAMAVDAIIFLPNVIANATGSRVTFFEYSKSSARSISSGYNPIESFVEAVLWFPLAILDEESNALSVNAAELEQMNYTTEEISEYKSDLTKIQQLTSNQSFSSQTEAVEAIHSLDLGIVAQEQMRLK
jgi:hypothetical protein